MLAGLDGTVLDKVLREGDHERAPVVEDVDLLALPLGKGIREADGRDGHYGANSGKDERVETQLPEGGLDVQQ